MFKKLYKDKKEWIELYKAGKTELALDRLSHQATELLGKGMEFLDMFGFYFEQQELKNRYIHVDAHLLDEMSRAYLSIMRDEKIKRFTCSNKSAHLWEELGCTVVGHTVRNSYTKKEKVALLATNAEEVEYKFDPCF